jgi:hypothetical protein
MRMVVSTLLSHDDFLTGHGHVDASNIDVPSMMVLMRRLHNHAATRHVFGEALQIRRLCANPLLHGF